MRSQFIIIYAIMLLFMTIFFLNNLKNESKFIYYSNNYKYIAENFYINTILYGCSVTNQTFYNYCKNYDLICYCNSTNVIVKGNNFEYIFNI